MCKVCYMQKVAILKVYPQGIKGCQLKNVPTGRAGIQKEEVWPIFWGVILLQLFWIPAPFRNIGCCCQSIGIFSSRHPLVRTSHPKVIKCHLMSSDVIWCHPVLSHVIWCHPMSSDDIWCHPMSLDVMQCHAVSSNLIHSQSHPVSSDVIHSHSHPYSSIVIWRHLKAEEITNKMDLL